MAKSKRKQKAELRNKKEEKQLIMWAIIITLILVVFVYFVYWSRV